MAKSLSEGFTNKLRDEREAELTEFSGCSDEDKACAKLFWQSVTLHPPIESRLVSGDIRQRLPVAGPFIQEVNYAYKPIEENPKLKLFLANAHGQMIYEESAKLTGLAIKRQETRYILEKRKFERAEKEKISRRTRKPLVPQDDYELMDEEGEAALRELERFDKTLEERSQRNLVV